LTLASDTPFVRLDSAKNLLQWARQLVGDLEMRLRSMTLMLNLIYTGKGSPEGVVKAPVGSLFLRSNGGAVTTLYVKESGTGNVGWVAK